jgi:hypothetical protein
VVPPLKIFQVTHRPGRPKKNATPPVPIERNNSIPSLPRDELPAGMSLEHKSDDR